MFSRIKNIIKIPYLAYHDALTGLYNRNWLYTHIKDIRHPYVYFIDINNLHEINKQGHVVGDEHIKHIVDLIKEDAEFNDLFIRYAGDEFLLFSYEKNRLHINDLWSVGVAELNNDIQTAIQNADHEMLKNKYKFNEKTN